MPIRPKLNAGLPPGGIRFCDLRCEHAEFAREDALGGGCRTWQSIWCNKLSRHVTKNAPCEARFGRRRPTTGL